MLAGPRRHLVLVGGGHAHVAVLRSLAMQREPAGRVTTINPHPYATYSGMVPGVLAGQYRPEEALIDVQALSARAHATFIPDRVVRVDADRRVLELAQRPALTFDIVSFDIGSQPLAPGRVATDAPAVMVKPIERALHEIQTALSRPAPEGGHQAVVVGAGAGGTEIAFALAARLRGHGRVTLCDIGSQPLEGVGWRVSRAVARALAQRGVQFIAGARVHRADANSVVLDDGRALPATLIVWATGAGGQTLFANSGLAVDKRGCVWITDELRALDHPDVFAAGDCATLESHRNLPKSGVYAVRQGPVLTHNLRAAMRGSARTQVFQPQRRVLALLNCGDGEAILSYGGFATQGRWVWRLKDRIDRAFIRKYERPSLDPDAGMGGEMEPCGGCAAKVSADVLTRVLGTLNVPPAEGIHVGLHPPDDAAVFTHPAGALAVATLDAFPPFSDDLFVVGQVAAVNAASDLYAMGAEGSIAIAFACLPRDEAEAEEGLTLLMRGALTALSDLGIQLAGGHSVAGEQPLFGFAMHGWVEPERIFRKGGARPGDRLVLTKSLGTGVVLAAARAGVAPAEWVDAAYTSMMRSNGPAMRLFKTAGVRSCTDVSGFGLAGHLGELLRAGNVGAHLNAGTLPVLTGAGELFKAGWRSSFHAANERAQAQCGAGETEPWLTALLHDPQTSGGLLAAVPATTLADLRRACVEAQQPLYEIGEIVAGPAIWELIA